MPLTIFKTSSRHRWRAGTAAYGFRNGERSKIVPAAPTADVRRLVVDSDMARCNSNSCLGRCCDLLWTAEDAGGFGLVSGAVSRPACFAELKEA